MLYEFNYFEKENGSKKSFSKDLAQTDSAVYKEVGELLNYVAIPSDILISDENGNDVFYNVFQRGKYVENGVAYPSIYVVEKRNSILYGVSHTGDRIGRQVRRWTGT